MPSKSNITHTNKKRKSVTKNSQIWFNTLAIIKADGKANKWFQDCLEMF